MKQYLLILLNLFFVNNFCMEQEPAPLNNRTTENQITFVAFFKDPVLRDKAEKALNNFSLQKLENPQSKTEIFCLLYNLPLDILKKIIFDYLINTDSVNEEGIYENFKSLSLTCKYFSNLSQPIIEQIVLISQNYIENYQNRIYLYHPIEPQIISIDNSLKENLKTSKCLLVASYTNKALWILCNLKRLQRFESRFVDGPDGNIDLIEICFIIAIRRFNDSAVKALLTWEEQNAGPYDQECKKLVWEKSIGLTPMHIVLRYFKFYNLSIIERFLKNKHVIDQADYYNYKPIDYLFLSARKEDDEKVRDIVALLLKYHLNSDLVYSLKSAVKNHARYYFPKTAKLISLQNLCQII